jgi:hypothetical protein
MVQVGLCEQCLPLFAVVTSMPRDVSKVAKKSLITCVARLMNTIARLQHECI